MTVYQDPIDIHHAFPVDWCEKQGIPPAIYNSIVNKTPMSAETNRAILRGDAPSVYLKRIEDRTGLTSDALDAILRTHLIDPALLRADDFDAFFEDRKGKLAALAGEAMGKAVIAESAADEGLPEDITADEEARMEAA
jgi:hypothetical protein